jgi:hypothetical protein
MMMMMMMSFPVTGGLIDCNHYSDRQPQCILLGKYRPQAARRIDS